MRLYRLGGDFLKGRASYSLKEIQNGRLDTGIIDNKALDALSLIVGGGIQSSSQLYAVEMALRGLIFHDSVEVLTPSAKIQIISDSMSQPFVTSISPDAVDKSPIREVLSDAIKTINMGGIDHLIGFADDDIAEKYIYQHEEERKKKQKAEDEKHKKMGIPKPSFVLDPVLAPLVFVANDKDEFFGEIFHGSPDVISRFLKPIPVSGHVAYIGDDVVKSHYEDLRVTHNAEQFFSTLDNHWDDYQNMLKRALNIPLPLFITVVLTRADKREYIPREIVALRQEFTDARRQLWELFDEADFRIYDTSVSARVLKDIEKAAASVIPDSLKANDYWFPIRFDLLGRLLELTNLGLVKDALEYLQSKLVSNCIRVDAANLLQKQLESVELRGLLERHLSEPELKRVINS